MFVTNLSDTEAIDRVLEDDPAGLYGALDATTRERYRQACLELAAWSKHSPVAVAHEAVHLSQEHDTGDLRGRHVGAQLLAEGRPRLEARLSCHVPRFEQIARIVRRHAVSAYIGSIIMLTILVLCGLKRVLSTQGVERLDGVLFLGVLALPILKFIHDIIDSALLHFMAAPVPLPKLEPERVLTQDTRTLVVTPLLITNAEDIEHQFRKMEINYQGNVSPNLLFALLTDFCDAPAQEMPGERVLLERLERGIRELNERHGFRERPRFFFLHRERRWNPVAGRWMGWERKRGKLEELNQLVLGASDTSYTGPVPDVIRTIRYIITLDADSQLLPGSAAQLVATIHHPLNRPRFDATGRRVIAGYSILQPSLAINPTRALWLASGGWSLSIARNRSQFLDPLSLSQTAFGIGGFLGKGIYDVVAFSRSLDGWIPENIILSHDKIEGMYARVAFVSDIVLFESQPTNIASTARIWHRWIRGDWQLLPWLFPWVPTRNGRIAPNPLSLLNRWKLLTDIYGVLDIPASLLALLYGWLWFPSSSIWAWTLGSTLWICRHSLVFPLVDTLRDALRHGSLAAAMRTVAAEVPSIVGDTLITLTTLLPSTVIVLDAVARALYRLMVDRSRALDWMTHAQSNRKVQELSLIAFPEIQGAAVLALVITGTLAAFNPGALPWALPLLFAWLLLPALISRDQPGPMTASGVPPTDLDGLRALARRSWALYERFEPGGGKLPQGFLTEEGASGDVTEVSPTDLALWLVAPLGAYHLGYLGLDGLLSRLDESLALIVSLERHRGHFLERYDIRSRRPVGPRRISTAESGVLSAALVVIESGLRAARASSPSLQALRQGLADTLAILREELTAQPPSAPRDRLLSMLIDIRAAMVDGATPTESVLADIRHRWAKLAENRAAQRNATPAATEASDLPAWWECLAHQLALLERASQPAAAFDTERLSARLEELEARARALREEMNFSFLYDGTVDLFHVGYDIETHSLEGTHHGLLTSGALLAGFIAISQGEVPLRHWLALLASDQRLRSTNGGFTERNTPGEHLLPTLFLWFPPATLLAQAALDTLAVDIESGSARGTPWGVDEALHGVQGVAPAQPVTVMPHLSLLALRFRPQRALENLRRMVEPGALGQYGLLDSRLVQPANRAVAVKHTITCRYQAIVLMAIANQVCDDILIQHFHQHWQTAWVEALVYETRDVP